MLRPTLLVTLLAGLAAAMIVGCAEDGGDAAPEPPSAASSAALAALSPEDRELAEQQKTCPVSKEPLGSMGTPIKVDVDGRTVFVCCDGCVDAVKENPDEYLRNL